MSLRGARVLVTGASGFVGTHLIARLRAEGAEVALINRAQLAAIDALTEQLDAIRPTHLYHMAGVLGGAPGGYEVQHEANVMTTVRLLEAVVAARLDPWIMVTSSSAVYGQTNPDENPLGEDRPFRPLTEYGVSQVGREMAALRYHVAHRLRTVRVRTFNLVGPGQPRTLLASDVAHQVALAERERGPLAVRVGNLFPRRDYTDVRDAVRAYVLLASSAQPGEVYNVCTGRSSSVQQCVDLFAGMVKEPLRIDVDETRIRPIEIADQIGDPSRIHQATGWQATIPLAVSLRDLLDAWRAHAAVVEATPA